MISMFGPSAAMPNIPPMIPTACQVGWISSEVGRQPWVVYNLLRTQPRQWLHQYA